MSRDTMPLSKKERRRVEREAYRQVARENQREADGTATRERVATAMEFIMEDWQTRNNIISQTLTQMLGSEARYKSKYEIKEEAMSRLYGVEPSDDDSSDTIIVDMDED